MRGMVTPDLLSPSQVTLAVGNVTSQLSHWELKTRCREKGGTRPTLGGACELGRGSGRVEGGCVQPALGLNLLLICLFWFAGKASSC